MRTQVPGVQWRPPPPDAGSAAPRSSRLGPGGEMPPRPTEGIGSPDGRAQGLGFLPPLVSETPHFRALVWR